MKAERGAGRSGPCNDLPTVVVVDDADEVRAVVKSALRLSGRFAVVGEGADGAEAIELARRLRPVVMLLDVSMPGLDGIAALQDVVSASPHSRVVMYTGFDDRRLAELALSHGAAGYVEKSEPIEHLAERLVELSSSGDGSTARSRRGAGEAPAPTAGDQRVLEDHLERFREVFEDAAIGMATMTLTGRIVRSNRVLEQSMAARGELVGQRYVELVAESERTRVDEAVLAAGRGGEGAAVELEHHLEIGGGLRPVLATIAPVLDREARPLYLFLQVRDMSVERATAAELRHSEERFRLLVEGVQDYAIFMLDTDGRVASWNVGAERIKGYRAEEILGRHFRAFYPPEEQASGHPEHNLSLALAEGRYEEEGWRIRRDGSRFWASVVITAVRDANGRHIGFGKVTRDVTERRRLLEELEAANERLARTAAEQSAFLGVTVHELRGSIGVLASTSELLSAHFAELSDAERADLLASQRTSAGRLRVLLADLLTVSRLDAGRMELNTRSVDLEEALHSAASRARRQHGEVRVEVCCDPSLQVLADPDRLAQMLDNLLTNALRHGRAPVRVLATAVAGSGAGAEVRVEDSGRGVPEEMRARLFARFAPSSSASGTGLGLYIVRELARAHGGDARYEADGRPGFVVSLPRLEQGRSETASRPLVAVHGNR